MNADEQQAVLQAMEPEDRAAIEDALSFPEERAGRLMQREFVAVPEHVTVSDVIDRLREDQDLTSHFWQLFHVDPMHRPVGTCQLTWILRTQRDIPLGDVLMREQSSFPLDLKQLEPPTP